jgi:hypothetical protein
MTPKSTIATVSLSIVLVAGACWAAEDPGAYEVPIGELVGANHVGGRYHFTDKPFLREGADRMLELGSRTMKIWLNSRPSINYSFNSDWAAYMDQVQSVTDLARTPYYREVFELPFKTFFLMTTEFCHPDILTGMDDEARRNVYDEIYELTSYLLNEYKGSGKTFVLKNWESDNHIRLFELPEAEWRLPIEGMIDWVNTRQRAVSDARAAVGMDGVAVYHAFEFVRIPVRRDFGHPTTLEAVVPHTRCDLYSYSNWAFNRRPGNQGLLLELLDYMAAVTPPSEAFGHRNLFLGEWGTYEAAFMTPQRPDLEGDTRVHDERSDRLQREVVMRNLDLAMGWGVRHALHWQLYCNGLRSGVSLARSEPAAEEQLTGVWLIRPGSQRLDVPPSYTSTWDALAELMMQRYLFDDMSRGGGVAASTSNVQFRSDEVDYHPTDPYRAGGASADPASLRYELAEDLRDFNVRLLHRQPGGDLVGYWPLDEWEGDHAYDKSGFGNDGKREGGVGIAEDGAPLDLRSDYAAEFSGKGRITIPAGGHYQAQNWTLTGWMNIPADLAGSRNGTVVSWGGAAFTIAVSPNTGQLSVRLFDGEIEMTVPAPAADLRGTGWRSFALVSGEGETRFYLDGLGAAGLPVGIGIPETEAIFIGGGAGHGSFHGKIGDIRLFKRAMSREEIFTQSVSPAGALGEAVRIRVSSDGQEWATVPFQVTYTREMNAEGIYSSFLRPVGVLPPGTRFFEIVWEGTSADFPEIGSVALRTGSLKNETE